MKRERESLLTFLRKEESKERYPHSIRESNAFGEKKEERRRKRNKKKE